MNRIFKILICVAIAILQIVLMPILSVNDVFPNIVLIGAVVLAFSDFEEDAFLLASFGGLILDLASNLPFGLNTIILVGLVALIRYILLKILPEINFFIIMLGVLIFSVLFAIIINLLLGRWSGRMYLTDGLYSTFLGLIFYWQFHYYQNKSQAIKV